MGFEKDLPEDLLVCVRGLLESGSPLTMALDKGKGWAGGSAIQEEFPDTPDWVRGPLCTFLLGAV